ncbi:Stf0 family sulfotransferase [Maricaulis sp. CAU 1757]
MKISAVLRPETAVMPASAGVPYRTMSEMFDYIATGGAPAADAHAELDERKLAARYLICMLPRSGSTYLAQLLKDTAAFGYPEEWLGVSRAEDQARAVGATDWDTLLRRVLARHASDNGVSGVELSLAQLTWGRQATGRRDVLDRGYRFFYLRRRNIVRQGISMHIAHQSGVLHSSQMTDEARQVRDAVLYQAEAIRAWIKFLHDEEMQWEREFGRLAIEPVRIYYEDIIARPERVIRLFAHVLDLPATPPVPEHNPVHRVSDSRSAEWEARYREEDADYLAGLTRMRPFVHQPVQMT